MNNFLAQQRPAADAAAPATEATNHQGAASPETRMPETRTPAGRSRLPGRLARLPELAGPGFLPLGLFARLPLAMLTVGTLTLVTSTSGSYAVGGAAAAAVGIGSALGAPILGSLADHAGQRRILLVAAVANAVAVAALLAASYLGAGAASLAESWAVIATAFVAGASCPQVGPMARVRWMALTTRNLAGGGSNRPGGPGSSNRPGGPGSAGAQRSVAANRADLDTALSYEGTADEITFVLGPALVGVLASLVAPWLPLTLAALLTITLVPLFAVHPTHLAVVPGPRRTRPHRPRPETTSPEATRPGTTRLETTSREATRPGTPLGARVPEQGPTAQPGPGSWLPVMLPVLAMVCMGTFFGATQTALTAFSGVFATPEVAGLLYAVMGLSSAVAALSVAFWPQRFGLAGRWLASAAAMAGMSVLLLLPAGIPPMILVLLVLGIPVGPVMVTVFGIGGVLAPKGRMSTVMTALASGIVAGTAVGASLAGQLAQGNGHGAAFVVSVVAAVALLILGTAAAWVLRNRHQASV